jgi:hypothetical protein
MAFKSRQGHGSRSCYLAGCKCDPCKEANAHYQRDYRLGRRGNNRYRMGGYRRIAADRQPDDGGPQPGGIWGRWVEPDS